MVLLLDPPHPFLAKKTFTHPTPSWQRRPSPTPPLPGKEDSGGLGGARIAHSTLELFIIGGKDGREVVEEGRWRHINGLYMDTSPIRNPPPVSPSAPRSLTVADWVALEWRIQPGVVLGESTSKTLKWSFDTLSLEAI